MNARGVEGAGGHGERSRDASVAIGGRDNEHHRRTAAGDRGRNLPPRGDTEPCHHRRTGLSAPRSRQGRLAGEERERSASGSKFGLADRTSFYLRYRSSANGVLPPRRRLPDDGRGREVSQQFRYLLNAMEAAAQAEHPAEHGYAARRVAVFEYVESLQAENARLRAGLDVSEAEVERLRTVGVNLVAKHADQLGELRSRLAEVEAERDELKALLHDANGMLADKIFDQISVVYGQRDRLAESQAEVARLRAALEEIVRSPSVNCVMGHDRACDCAGDKVRAALSSSPGDALATVREAQEALVEVSGALKILDRRHERLSLDPILERADSARAALAKHFGEPEGEER